MQSDSTSTTAASSKNNNNSGEKIMKSSTQDLSFTILWSPLPFLTWLIPFIGHVGIGDSNGCASDFQGPYFVGDDGRMAFGSPTRALKIDIGDLPGGAERWDEAIEEANNLYRGRMHNLCCDNCHSHVAHTLNLMPAKSPICGRWNMVVVCFYVFFKAKFLNRVGVVLQFGPFLVLLFVYLMIKNME
jgi:hypothetical protein